MIDKNVDINRLKKIVELSDGNMEVCTITIPIFVNTVGVSAGLYTAYRKYHKH